MPKSRRHLRSPVIGHDLQLRVEIEEEILLEGNNQTSVGSNGRWRRETRDETGESSRRVSRPERRLVNAPIIRTQSTLHPALKCFIDIVIVSSRGERRTLCISVNDPITRHGSRAYPLQTSRVNMYPRYPEGVSILVKLGRRTSRK